MRAREEILFAIIYESVIFPMQQAPQTRQTDERKAGSSLVDFGAKGRLKKYSVS